MPEDLTHTELMQIHLAAIGGNAILAHELELIGLSDEHDSLDDARALRSVVLQAMEQERGE